MPHPRVRFLELTTGAALIHSEEHLVVESEKTDGVVVGDMVYALPVHICPTMALHDRVYVVSEGYVTGTWQVAARSRNYII
jgi:D-serine deaminase-like pyridoxal phosphate-dependent protein